MPTAAERRKALDQVADELLAQQAEAAQVTLERQEQAEAEAERRASLEAIRADLIERRETATGRAEASCREMCEQLRSILDLARQEREVCSALGAGQGGIRAADLEKSLSNRISAVLRTITGKARYFGYLELSSFPVHAEQSWLDTALAPRKINGANTDAEN